MPESTHEKLKRVRKPHVHITMDVETNGAVEKKELPFVIGVMGDFSGNPTTPPKSLKDRNFTQVDRDNFNEVMAKISPELNIRVQNTLQDDGSEIGVQLKFRSMDDFSPAAVARQVEPTRKLLEVREQLTELAAWVDRSDKLESILEKTLQDNDTLARLKAENEGGK